MRFHALAAGVLWAALGLPGCGGGNSAPTPTFVRTTETGSGTNLAAGTTLCVGFNNARAGEVSVYVTPPSIHLTLRAGTCEAPGQVLTEQDGNVTADAPAGWNHVTLSNRSAADTAYTLSLTHWL